jgi:5-formyltetrahydrofolate cyclo-ligase
MTETALAKRELRAVLRANRAAFVSSLGDARAALESRLAERVAAHLSGCGVVAAYVASGSEIDPLAILETAHARDIHTALPSIEADSGNLVFRLWAPGDPLMEGPLRLRQPLPSAFAASPDLILAPLLGFDRAMNRIGQGKGYYDRVFAALPAARRVGLAWSAQETSALALDPWDEPLHAVATEREWIERS